MPWLSPVASSLPFGLKAGLHRCDTSGRRWSVSSNRTFPAARSHRRTTLSRPAAARVVPSGLKASVACGPGGSSFPGGCGDPKHGHQLGQIVLGVADGLIQNLFGNVLAAQGIGGGGPAGQFLRRRHLTRASAVRAPARAPAGCAGGGSSGVGLTAVYSRLRLRVRSRKIR